MHQQIHPRMVKGEYIGTDSKLYGKTASLLVRENLDGTKGRIVKAQFDDVSTGLGHGWHPFMLTQFQITD